jgi:hypothetical protein
VTIVRSVINEGPESLTVTPGTTARVLSVTLPLMAPVVAVTVCAAAGTTQRPSTIHSARPAMPDRAGCGRRAGVDAMDRRAVHTRARRLWKRDIRAWFLALPLDARRAVRGLAKWFGSLHPFQPGAVADLHAAPTAVGFL